MRANARLEPGGLDDYAGWKRVSRTLEGLQGTELGPEVRVHWAPVSQPDFTIESALNCPILAYPLYQGQFLGSPLVPSYSPLELGYWILMMEPSGMQ